MVAPRVTAGEQLERLLYILSVAAREDGCRLEDLAEAVGTTIEQVVRDIEEVTARAFYHPAGSVEDLQILMEGDRVRIWTAGEFRSPVKLSPREALALALGFRVLAAERDPSRRVALLAHAARLESQVSVSAVEDVVDGFAIDHGDRGDSDILAEIRGATREQRSCEIEYLKPGKEHPERRVLQPYTLLRAGAGWYVLGYCRRREDIRAFRLDRILSLRVLTEGFDVPSDFDPDAWVAAGGRVYRSPGDVEVCVRYSPRIARWIREKGPVEEQADGSVVLRHRVADPEWVVRHVLQYGPDAEILEPASCRSLVVAALAAVAG